MLNQQEVSHLKAFDLDVSNPGSINFSNYPNIVPGPQRVSGPEGFLDGPQYQIQLWAGPDLPHLEPLSTTGFQSGAGAGYFAGGYYTQETSRVFVPNVNAGDDALVRLIAWDTATGADYDSATVKGASDLFYVTTGGAGRPPSLPGNMVNFTAFSISQAPEPSTFALFLLAAAGFALLCRRKFFSFRKAGRQPAPSAHLSADLR